MRRIRRWVLVVLLALIVGAAVLLLAFPQQRRIILNPHIIGQDVRLWVANHPVAAPVSFIALYFVLSILALPVWWLQILGGYGFGLVMGVVWGQVGATVGATATLLLSRWLTAEWFVDPTHSKRRRLHAVSEKLGHNGLLVVMAVRLAHVLPFGISNYLFGLTPITLADVAAGSFLGGFPSAIVYVTLGANRHLFTHWQFIVLVVGLDLLLLSPLALRYWRPGWFKKFGIE